MAYSPLSIAASILEIVQNAVIGKSLVQIAALAGALDLSTSANEGKHAMILSLDCGGSGRAVTLPTASTSHGLLILIINDSNGAENVTVNTSLAVINQNEAALFWNNAGTWTRPVGFSTVQDQSA